MGKVEIGIQHFRDTLMVRKLFAIIRRDRMGSDRQRLHELDNSIRHGLSRFILNLSQEGQTRLSLNQGDNGMTMSFSNKGIHFPITQALTSIDDLRSFVDTHSVLEYSTPVIAPVALPALLLAS